MSLGDRKVNYGINYFKYKKKISDKMKSNRLELVKKCQINVIWIQKCNEKENLTNED